MQGSGSGQIGLPKGSEFGRGLLGGADRSKAGGERESAFSFSLSMSIPFLHGQHIDVQLQRDDSNNDDNNNNNRTKENNSGSGSSNVNKISNDWINAKKKKNQFDKSKLANHENGKLKDFETVEKIVFDKLNLTVLALETTADGWNINDNNNDENNASLNNNRSNNHDNENGIWRSPMFQSTLTSFQPLFYSNMNIEKETFRNGSSEVSPYLMMKSVRVPLLYSNPAYPLSRHSTGQNHPTQNHPTQNHPTQNHPTQNHPTQKHFTYSLFFGLYYKTI